MDVRPEREQERPPRGDNGERWQCDGDTPRHQGVSVGDAQHNSRLDGGGGGAAANDVNAASHRRSQPLKAISTTALSSSARVEFHTHQQHTEDGFDGAAQDAEQPGCVLLLSAGADHAAYYSPVGRHGGLRKVGCSLQAMQVGPAASPCELRRQKTTSWLPGSWSSWFGGGGGGSSAGVADHCETNSKEVQPVETRDTALGEVEDEAQEGGHEFRACGQPTWCDLCGEFMWGVARRSLRCQRCKFSCHQRCQSHVRLECQHGWAQSDEPLLHDTGGDSSSGDDPLRPLTPEELQRRIEWYNEQVDNGLRITLHASGRYTGFIRVELKLCRPVSVQGGGSSDPCTPTPSPPPTPPPCRDPGDPSDSDVFATATSRAPCRYLPKGSSKQLHVGSLTTAREVVRALLRRFAVLDDPRKFALFARTQAGGQVRLRKLSDGEKPLYLQLLAGPDPTTLSFLLKENESGDVLWEAFSVPELNNFLRILSLEEDEHVRLVLRRYTAFRGRLLQLLGARSPG